LAKLKGWTALFIGITIKSHIDIYSFPSIVKDNAIIFIFDPSYPESKIKEVTLVIVITRIFDQLAAIS